MNKNAKFSISIEGEERIFSSMQEAKLYYELMKAQIDAQIQIQKIQMEAQRAFFDKNVPENFTSEERENVRKYNL